MNEPDSISLETLSQLREILTVSNVDVVWSVRCEIGPEWIGGGREIELSHNGKQLSGPFCEDLILAIIAAVPIPSESFDSVIAGEGEIAIRDRKLTLEFEWTEAVPYGPVRNSGHGMVELSPSTSTCPIRDKGTPSPEEIRDRFRKRLGDKRYQDFVYHVPGSADGARLRFWQEREWNRFVNDNPDCELDFSGIIDVFAACPEFGSIVRHEAYCELLFSWLQGEPMSIKEVERQYGTNRVENRQQPESFGIGSKQWQNLKAQFQPGDELYRFRSPPKSWANMAGRAGIALVRDGKVVDVLITIMN